MGFSNKPTWLKIMLIKLKIGSFYGALYTEHTSTRSRAVPQLLMRWNEFFSSSTPKICDRQTVHGVTQAILTYWKDKCDSSRLWSSINVSAKIDTTSRYNFSLIYMLSLAILSDQPGPYLIQEVMICHMTLFWVKIPCQ